MTASEDASEFDPGETIVLNALLDLHAEETLVLDPDSERVLATVVEDVAQREAIDDAREQLVDLSTLDRGESAQISPAVARYTKEVATEIEERGHSISIRHEHREQLSPRDAYLYTSIHTEDTEPMTALDLRSPVEAALRQGLDCLAEDSPGDACAHFSTAVERAADRTEVVVSNVLAGWGQFKVGEDEHAMEHVEAALDADETSWAAKVVGSSITDEDRAAIRDGQKAVGISLRWESIEPGSSSVWAEVADLSRDGEIQWEPVDHLGGHAYLRTVYPEMGVRFRLHGTVSEFPAMQMYFLSISRYNVEMDLLEKVYKHLGSGPRGSNTVESITIEQ